MTLSILFCLTGFAYYCKEEFKGLLAFLLISIVSLIILSISMIFYFNYWMYLVVSFIGCLIYGIYLIIDIQMIVGRYGEMCYDDYIIGALIIYIDIICLFLRLLQLITLILGK